MFASLPHLILVYSGESNWPVEPEPGFVSDSGHYSPGTHQCGKRFTKRKKFSKQYVFFFFSRNTPLRQKIHKNTLFSTFVLTTACLYSPGTHYCDKRFKEKISCKNFFLKTKCLHSPGIHHCGKRFKEKYKKIFLKKDPVISLLSHFLPGNKDLFCLATRSFFGDKNLFVLDVCFCLVDNGHFQYSHWQSGRKNSPKRDGMGFRHSSSQQGCGVENLKRLKI